MTDASFLPVVLRGVAIGFAIAAPVGPIGILCIRRTLDGGRLAGLATGLGAATADAVYGAVAGFGLTAISGFLVQHASALRLGGGLFLCALGVRAWLARPAPAASAGVVDRRGLAAAYGSTFLLTLANPATILSFVAIFVGLGIAGQGVARAIALVSGVFAGSAAWWLGLSAGVAALRRRVDTRAMRWISWVSGCVLVVFGLVALFGRR